MVEPKNRFINPKKDLDIARFQGMIQLALGAFFFASKERR